MPFFTVDNLVPLADNSRDAAKQADLIYRLASRLIETCEQEYDTKSSDAWNGGRITRTRRTADEARRQAVGQLGQVRDAWRQADWLEELGI